jgi:protein SCO1/2
MKHEMGSPQKPISIVIALICVGSFIACSRSKQPTEANLKHYQLTGRVVAIDKPNKSITVDGDEIPGFMSAMQMPYDVKNASLLDKLVPGDKIAADVVVKEDESWLENIRVTQPSTPTTKPSSRLLVAKATVV